MTNPNEYRFGNLGLIFYRGKYKYGLGTALYFMTGTMPAMKLSLNLDDIRLPDNQIFLNPEYYMLSNQMIEDGLLELTGFKKRIGITEYPAARITEKLEKIVIDY